MHSVELERIGDAAVVSATGELDAFVAPDLEGAFAEAAHSARVVVDLGSVSFLDSTALGIVVRALREIGQGGGAATIVLPRGSARRIFEITTLDRVLPVAEDREAAFGEGWIPPTME